MTPLVTLYGRPGCCLCYEAREQLEHVRAHRPFRLEEIDITADDALHRRFLERIPVVALNGEEIYDYAIDAADLLRRLDEPSSPDVRRIE